jgi:CRP-like cAMP-binding protein
MLQNNQSKKTLNPLEASSAEGKNGTRSIFVGTGQWEKLGIVRDELGSWNLLADVAVEQLLASGLISEEARQKIHEITRRDLQRGVQYFTAAELNKALTRLAAEGLIELHGKTVTAVPLAEFVEALHARPEFL